MTKHQKIRLEKLLTSLAADFSITKLSKSPARFNLEKLNWFNRQYIQMLSLKEFCYLAFQNKLSKTYPEKKLRIGDYTYLIDSEKQKVFMNFLNEDVNIGDGSFYPIGGGREQGETEIDNLIRETDEETYGKIKINPDNIKKIGSFSILAQNPYEYLGQTWEGKTMNMFYYPIDISELDEYVLEDSGSWSYKWYDISEVVESNDFITYPIWKNFCQENNLICFEPTEKIRTQYLAWLLDKNRVAVLSELGAESDCILNWKPIEPEHLKWKKITLEESLQNLKEVYNYIESIHLTLLDQQKELYNSIFEDNLNQSFKNLSGNWETKIKDWLDTNGKDTGSYLWPLRVGLSGKLKSPSPFEILSILPFSEVQKRISSYLNIDSQG